MPIYYWHTTFIKIEMNSVFILFISCVLDNLIINENCFELHFVNTVIKNIDINRMGKNYKSISLIFEHMEKSDIDEHSMKQFKEIIKARNLSLNDNFHFEECDWLKEELSRLD